MDESFHNYLKNNVSNELKEKFFTNTNANYSSKSEEQTMKTSIDKTMNTCSTNNDNSSNYSTTSSTPYEEDSLNVRAMTTHTESVYEEDSIESIPTQNFEQENNASIDKQTDDSSIILINSSSDYSSNNSLSESNNNQVNQSTDYFTSDEILIKKENRDESFITISSDNNTNKSFGSSSYQTANMGILSNDNSVLSRYKPHYNYLIIFNLIFVVVVYK